MYAKAALCLTLLGTFVAPAVQAVHPLPAIPNSCLYVLATPHRPDPAPVLPLSTPEQRCQRADVFSLGNVPTTPVGAIEPSGEPRYYCTLDGSTLAVPIALHNRDDALAAKLPGATPCTGDAVCAGLFGEDATCEAFGPDASGRAENGWTSLGPARSFAVASDLDGDPGAHSVYVRSSNGEGHIFYLQSGMQRTHSLTAAGNLFDGDLPILDITFCKAVSSPIAQTGRVDGCTGFCRSEPCCGPHFPCAGAPNFPALTPKPEARLAGLDLQLETLATSGAMNRGQSAGMRQRIARIFNSLESNQLAQACHHMDQFILSIEHNIRNRSLTSDDAGPLEAEAILLRVELGCT